MANPVEIPGAKWLRCDLHVHTPFDGEKKFGENIQAAIDAFRKADSTKLSQIAERFISACLREADGQSLDIVALTDHNSIEGYKRLKPSFSSIEQRLADENMKIPVILPGVEFSVGGERPIHFLVIFAKETKEADIEECIRHVFNPREPFDPIKGIPRPTGESVNDFLQKLYEYCSPPGRDRHLSFLVLPAHADGSSGIAKVTGAHLPQGVAANIWEEMKGQLRLWGITRREWHGFQTNKPFSELPQEFQNLLYQWLAIRKNLEWDQLSQSAKERIRQERYWPLIETSDPHNYEEVGARYTWIKMEIPDVEGIRIALLDPQSRLRRMIEGPPGSEYPMIRQLSIQNTDFFENFEMRFNPCLNTLIGGRGTGKSTIIECLRYGLDRTRKEDFNSDDDEIYSMVESFLKQKSDRDYGQTKGMLLPDYRITAEIQISGRKYKVIRDKNGISVIPDPDKGDTAPGFFDVRTLFSPRIFSQKQIAHIAKDPAAQRRELDALLSPGEIQAFERTQLELLNEMEQLQLTRKKLKDQKAKIPGLKTELQKIADQIALLEQGGNKEILKRFQDFQSEQTWLKETFGGLAELMESFKDQDGKLNEIKDKMVAPPSGPNQSWLETIAQKIKNRIDSALSDLKKISEAMESLHQELKQEQATKWEPEFKAAVESYKNLEKDLKNKGVQFGQHEKHMQQRILLEKEIWRLETVDAELSAIEEKIKNSKDRLVLLHEERLNKRNSMASLLEAQDADVRLEIVPFRDRDDFDSQRDVWFTATGLQTRDWEILVEYVYSKSGNIPERIHKLAEALRKDIEITERMGKTINLESSEVAKLLGEPIASQVTRNFFNTLLRRDRIYLDKMERFLPEDLVIAKVRGADGVFKPIEQGSIGQRSTAILSLLLSSGDQPLIIDQPEDDLDNQYIYEVVVDLLRKKKFSCQIIIATHNANIPVNGDAELIVALDVENRLGHLFEQGSIDKPKVKEQVSRIMEGSAEAFRLRKERYGY